jgi:hypothetical protein
MHLVQILLPLFDVSGKAFPNAEYAAVRRELTERFGGVTAFVRAPAKGIWKEDTGETIQDDIVIYEVMADAVDAGWWTAYRRDLCRRFDQEEIVVRAHEIQRL